GGRSDVHPPRADGSPRRATPAAPPVLLLRGLPAPEHRTPRGSDPPPDGWPRGRPRCARTARRAAARHPAEGAPSPEETAGARAQPDAPPRPRERVPGPPRATALAEWP